MSVVRELQRGGRVGMTDAVGEVERGQSVSAAHAWMIHGAGTLFAGQAQSEVAE